ncbi:hypothetical protein BV20DRAFT_709555 [Pilatotrama ljubarskyi]|nr:hypothetical protein BV20DRAFT_709555 [Pilatotrama ljubarskyi]
MVQEGGGPFVPPPQGVVRAPAAGAKEGIRVQARSIEFMSLAASIFRSEVEGCALEISMRLSTPHPSADLTPAVSKGFPQRARGNHANAVSPLSTSLRSKVRWGYHAALLRRASHAMTAGQKSCRRRSSKKGARELHVPCPGIVAFLQDSLVCRSACPLSADRVFRWPGYLLVDVRNQPTVLPVRRRVHTSLGACMWRWA